MEWPSDVVIRVLVSKDKILRSTMSWPWRMELLNNHNHSDARVIFSSKNRLKKVVRSKDSQNQDAVQVQVHKCTKAGGMLRHSVHSLKKVARLPSKDHLEVPMSLKKKVRKRHGKAPRALQRAGQN